MGQPRAATIAESGPRSEDQQEFARALEKRLARLVEQARAKRRTRRSSQTSARSEPDTENGLQAGAGAGVDNDRDDDIQQRPAVFESSSSFPLPATRERPAPIIPRTTARERLLQSQMQAITGVGRSTEAATSTGTAAPPDSSSERDTESALSVYSVASELETYTNTADSNGAGPHPSSGGPVGSLAKRSSLRIDLLRAQRERTRGNLTENGATHSKDANRCAFCFHRIYIIFIY